MSAVDLSVASIFMTIVAGVASVASPCVLPVVPIIVTGSAEDHRLRPVLIVAGLTISFMAMGVLSSLFGGALSGIMPWLEKFAGVLILGFGVLLLFDVNPFKKITLFARIGGGQSRGVWSGLLMGLTLGLVWIPCVGPILAGVLTLVATDGRLSTGLILLAFYSLGFAIPMLLLGYASQKVRNRIRQVNAHPLAVRFFSGGILMIFGALILSQGMMGILSAL